MKGLDKLKGINLSAERFKSKLKSPKYQDWKEQREIKAKMRKSDVFRPDTLLLVIDGTDARPIWTDKDADDRRLLYEEDGKAQECKILSKPLEIGNTDIYFTRDGFKGTMALNKDTLLDADVYTNKKAVEDGKLEKDGDDGYYGEIESLVGSKATLKSSNEALRERKLLTPQSMSTTKTLMILGSGTAVGLVLATQLGI